jgi:formamidopyrimidine-DNA glycosylase
LPELPEVETIARGLARCLVDRRICHIALARRDMLHGNGGPIQSLVGRCIIDVQRYGKQVRILLSTKGDAAPAMFVHLGMTGRLLVVPCDAPVEKHTHLTVSFDACDSELRFCDPRRFGGIWLVLEGEAAVSARWQGRRLPPIGADPLVLTHAALRKLLDRKRQIKPLLMDQIPISGMGNIYCDEALFRAGIHPLTPAANLDSDAVRRLRTAIRRVLNEAIRAGGSSISDYRNAENGRGSFQERHRVYGRQGSPCPVCGSPVERFVLAGRGTHVCPQCQPLPLGKRPGRRV